jgi:phospholipase C
VVQLCGLNATYPPGGPYPKIDNSGFVANYATTTTEKLHATPTEYGDVMGCFNTPIQLPILYELATQFACCDHWFSSLPGPTWPNRFFVHGASSNGLDHSPSSTEIIEWEIPGSGGFTLPHGSIYDEMNVNEISYGLFIDTDGTIEGSAAQVASLHNLSMLNVRSVNDFVADLQGDYPYQYTFIEPNYGDITLTYENGSSQHPIDGVKRGEELIKKVYEAIRNSGIWEKSLLIITYDEHGGFYDHFPPFPAHNPDDGSDSSKWNKSGFLFDRLGVRVPAVIVSPWIQAQVDSRDYDHTSVLSTIERLFGLNSLTERDRNAHSVLDLIGKQLRANCPTKLGNPASEPARPALTEVQQAMRDQEPLEPRGNHYGFLHVAMKTDLEMSGNTPAERAAIMAKVQSIKTRGEAKAYVRSVVARVRAAQALR